MTYLHPKTCLLSAALTVVLAALVPRATIGQEVIPAPPPAVLPAPLPAPGGAVLSIDDAAGLALGNSPLLRRGRANVDRARGQAIQAGLYPNPRVDTGNPQQLGGSNTLFNSGLSQEWVRGGKLRLDVAAAEQFVRQSELGFLRQRFDLLTAVRQQFFGVLASQERSATLRSLVGIANQSAEISQKLLQAGQGTETDVLLLRIELRRIEADLQNAETLTRAGRQQLAAILGIPDLRVDRVVGDLSVVLPDYDERAMREQILLRHTAIQLARVDVERNRILLRRAEVEPTPNVTWTGGYQYTTSATHNQALVNAVFGIPLWNRNQGNIRAANANVSQAVAQLSAQQNELLRQAAEAMARYRSAQKLVTNYQQSILPDARRTVRLVQQGYEQGQLDFVRLLEAQRSLFQANLDYIEAQQDRLNAAADIANLLQAERFP